MTKKKGLRRIMRESDELERPRKDGRIEGRRKDERKDGRSKGD